MIPWQLEAQGDRCLLVRFGDALDERVGRFCLAAARRLREASLPGVTDIVPSFAAVAVHYRPGADGPGYPQLAEAVTQALAGDIRADDVAGREVEIPVCYGGEYGPDLPEVAAPPASREDDVVALHSRPGSIVFMLGFAPGTLYIGVHDEKLAIPRRDTPRLTLPAGAIGIANRQTVIYPGGLPGGWNIIGATPLVMFDPAREPAALLAPATASASTPIERQDLRAHARGEAG